MSLWVRVDVHAGSPCGGPRLAVVHRNSLLEASRVCVLGVVLAIGRVRRGGAGLHLPRTWTLWRSPRKSLGFPGLGAE